MNNLTQIKILKAGTPEDLVKKINLELYESGVFASPIHQDNITNQWICFIYSRNLEVKEVLEQPKEINTPHEKEDKMMVTPNSNINDSSTSVGEKSKSKPFKPTEEMLERWKTIKPTFKTKGLLMKKGYSNEEIKQIKTQYAAYIILENLKEENI